MGREDDVVRKVSAAIAGQIRHRAGAGGLTSVDSVKRLCRRDFGIAVKSLVLPLDYYGEVFGDSDAENATIVVNAAQPAATQIQVLFHELAECLARRGPHQFGCTENDLAALSIGPVEMRHQVAVMVEMELSAELGLDRVRSSWTVGDLLRVFPLDPKYIRPRTEIERVVDDVVM